MRMAKENASESLIELKVFLATIILLGILIIAAGAASYFIPAGQLTETVTDGRTTHMYQRIGQTPVPVWKIALSPLMSLTGKNGPKIVVLILFILIIGGSFSVMNNSGILPKMLSDLVGRFAHQKSLFLVINVLLFSLLGSCLGILEEIVPMILIFVPLAYRMGWDATTGMASPFYRPGSVLPRPPSTPSPSARPRNWPTCRFFQVWHCGCPFFASPPLPWPCTCFITHGRSKKTRVGVPHTLLTKRSAER
jgi:C4-dicarboxylate anaerobic carrier